MQKVEDLNQEIRKFFFQDRWTNIVAYRGAICTMQSCNQKGSPMVHWIRGKLYAKT